MELLTRVLEIQKDSNEAFLRNFCHEGEFINPEGGRTRYTTCNIDAQHFITFMNQRDALIIEALS